MFIQLNIIDMISLNYNPQKLLPFTNNISLIIITHLTPQFSHNPPIMQHQSQSQSSSQNDCYSTNQEYFLDICRFGQFDEIKEFLSTVSIQSKFDWEWTSNTGDNFVHMLAGNNFPEIFVYLMSELKQRGLQDKIVGIVNKQNSTGNTPLHYTVITESKDMLNKLLEYGCDPTLTNQFERTALDEAEMIRKFQIAEILAPVTKQDIEKLKKEFGSMDVCNEDSSQEDEEEEEKDNEKIEQKKDE